MNFLGVLTLSLRALMRKKGRNLLTMAGVFIGVFALTLIISLGQGLNTVITDTVSGDDNLRQIGMSGGFGIDLKDADKDIVIEGEMSEERRERLARAASVRRQVRQMIGRRANTLTDEVLEKVAEIDHVESVKPILVERYRLHFDDHNTDATLTFGVDVSRRRYEERLIAGKYLSSPEADEVLVHEYMLYRFGYVTEEECASVVGKKLTLTTIPAAEAMPAGLPDASAIRQMIEEAGLTEEEKKALPSILMKLGGRLANPGEQADVSREFTIVGVLRESESGDPFNLVEDGNAVQADVFLPDHTAREFFLSSEINRQLGYGRALVMVDDSSQAQAVETELRERGYTAFSVASVLSRVDSSLTIITVIISFLTGIALVVATLGIINTMVTSVLERTREIGVWKAVGATDFQVMIVFLAESALIGLTGGLLGLGVAWLATVPGDAMASRMVAEQSGIPFEGGVFRMPLWLILTGPTMGTVVAVLAAVWPASRAARIDPVKALRHD